MKFKRIMIVSMILLAIFAIGAVSAADENVTSNTLAIEDETADSVGEAQVLSYSSQDIVRENESVDEPKFTLEILDKAYQGIPAEVKFRGPSDISGSLYILGDAQYFSRHMKTELPYLTLHSTIRESILLDMI